MDRTFYFIVLTTVGSHQEPLFLKSNHKFVRNEVETMIKLMDFCKELSSDTYKDYFKKINKIINKEFENIFNVSRVYNEKEELFEESSVCFILPNEQKYCFMNIRNEMDMFSGPSHKLRRYTAERWLELHYPIDGIFELGYYNIGDNLSKLVEECIHLAKLTESFSLIEEEKIEEYLEMIGLY